MDIENQESEYQTFNFEDGDYRTTFTKKFLNRKVYVAPDPKKVFAFIPGTIVKIYVKEKHRVKKGEPLLTFQAMKMNNILQERRIVSEIASVGGVQLRREDREE
jgi:biotin carboxyl carrier protein